MAARDLPGFIAWPPLGTPMTAEQIAETRAALNIPAFIQGLRAAAPSIDVPPTTEVQHGHTEQSAGAAGERPGAHQRHGTRNAGRTRVATSAAPTAAGKLSG